MFFELSLVRSFTWLIAEKASSKIENSNVIAKGEYKVESKIASARPFPPITAAVKNCKE